MAVEGLDFRDQEVMAGSLAQEDQESADGIVDQASLSVHIRAGILAWDHNLSFLSGLALQGFVVWLQLGRTRASSGLVSFYDEKPLQLDRMAVFSGPKSGTYSFVGNRRLCRLSIEVAADFAVPKKPPLDRKSATYACRIIHYAIHDQVVGQLSEFSDFSKPFP